MGMMGIMSPQEFQNATAATGIAVKSLKAMVRGMPPILNTIYIRLDAWDSLSSNWAEISNTQKSAVLVNLNSACKAFMKMPSPKDPLSKRRHDVVGGIQASVLAALQIVNPVLGQMEKRKAYTSTALAEKGTPLSGNYQFERQGYVDVKKAFAPSATGVNSEVMNARQHGDTTQTFDTLTYNDYLRWYNVSPNDNQVVYLRKESRGQYLAVVYNGKFMRMNGPELNCPAGRGHGNRVVRPDMMYAMDRYGNLFVDDRRTLIAGAKAQGEKYFNHSSFCGGREVICAGEMIFEQGRLLLVNNGSGHYKPTAADLQTMLVFLAQEGAKLDRTRVDVLDVGGTTRSLQASTFLNNPGAASDWPAQRNLLSGLPD